MHGMATMKMIIKILGFGEIFKVMIVFSEQYKTVLANNGSTKQIPTMMLYSLHKATQVGSSGIHSGISVSQPLILQQGT